MSRASQLRAILSAPGAVPMPSCHDALSARLIEQAGFSVAFMSGFSTSAAKLGRPDVQLITFSEMLEQVRTPLSALIAPHRLTFSLSQARLIQEVTTIPIIVDGDNGHGGPLNVKRCLRGFR